MVRELAQLVGAEPPIETHISSVLLTADFAYKFKKPLDLGFLDFSSLEKRRAACEEELRLNRRTAPDLYLGVQAIYGSALAPSLEGHGPILDYAVKMRRFDESLSLDKVLARGELREAHMDELAAGMAEFHGEIPTSLDHAETAHYGMPAGVLAPMLDNFEALAEYASGGEESLLVKLRQWTEAQYLRLQARLSARQEQGFVRECHGDAHLGNIALIDGRVTLFDCIEFNPNLRWTDVMADLAFASMDLHDRGADALAYRLVDRYLAKSGDYGGAALLRFYEVYRAMVRAKVAGLRAGQDAGECAHSLAEMHTYLELSERITGHALPSLILMHGVSASGKSWLSQTLLQAMGALRLRSDLERKRMFAGDPNLYSQACTTATYRRLLELSRELVGAGFPVIVDATFLDFARREPFHDLASELLVPLTIVHTFAPKVTLLERIERRAREANNISDADAKVLEVQLAAIETFRPQERVVRVDTNIPLDLPSILERVS